MSFSQFTSKLLERLAEPFVPMLISHLSEIKIRPPRKGDKPRPALLRMGFGVESFLVAHFRRNLEPSRNGAFSFLETVSTQAGKTPVSCEPASAARQSRHLAVTPPV